MYAVTINLYTDGDFGYIDTEFHIEPETERTYYFETRKDHDFTTFWQLFCRDNLSRFGSAPTSYSHWFQQGGKYVASIGFEPMTFGLWVRRAGLCSNLQYCEYSEILGGTVSIHFFDRILILRKSSNLAGFVVSHLDFKSNDIFLITKQITFNFFLYFLKIFFEFFVGFAKIVDGFFAV